MFTKNPTFKGNIAKTLLIILGIIVAFLLTMNSGVLSFEDSELLQRIIPESMLANDHQPEVPDGNVTHDFSNNVISLVIEKFSTLSKFR